jgi:hypothetical protein
LCGGGLFLPPGCTVDVGHCGQPMMHATSTMQWAVNRFDLRQSVLGWSRHAFACQHCQARAAVDLELPEAVWQFRPQQVAGGSSPSRRAVARRAAIAEWDRLVRERVAAAPHEHATTIADAVVAALEELG